MANRYFLNIGANWGDTANWSDTSGGTGGFSVPTNVDDVFFDANSGNCTVNASARTALTLNFTGYTNTITMTFAITVSGSVTLVAAMTIAGASGLTINATGTFTSNGKTWPNALTFSATNTLTLADDLTVNGLLTISGNTTVNGTFNINANGGTTLNGVSIGKGTGTPKLYFKGGTVQSSNTLGRISIDSYIDGNITIGSIFVIGDNGSINYVSGVVTNTANNTVSFANLNVSINLAGVTLNNVNFTSATNNYTITLLSDLNINGLLTTTGGTISGSFNINVSGGITVINNGIFAQGTGTTTLNLLGGTWSITGTGVIRLNTVINGNVTISGNVYYNTGTLTYTSGTVTVTSSTLILGTCTMNTGALMWNNIQTGNPATTLTLSSDLNINGEWNQNIFGTTINGSFNINCFGGIFAQVGAGQGTGSPVLNIKGGTWRGTGTQTLNTNIDGDVNITLAGGGFSTRTLTYVSGNVTCASTSNVYLGGTLNVAQIQFANAVVQGATLLADLNISGQVSSSAIGANGAFNVNIGNGLRVTANQLGGTATFVIRGGTIDLTGAVNGALNANVVINGNVYILFYNQLGGTLTYLGGTVTGDLLAISSGGSGNPTLINMDKVQLRRVNITAGQNLQMNKFFNGTASNPTRIQGATAGATYVVTFQDTFEKIANNVKVSGCTVSRPGQLIINGANSNKGTNTGIRYINQSPNGLPKNSPPIPTQMTFGIGNISDPTMVIS